jgi:hypothetical protein
VIRSAILLALAMQIAGCRDRPAVASCNDDLAGMYVVDGKRWNLADGRPNSYEAYPQFDDATVLPGGIVAAPRVMDVSRTEAGLSGVVRRRYMRGSDSCDARQPVRITACADDEVQLVITDPIPPLAFGPCKWGRADGSHVERWRRER